MKLFTMFGTGAAVALMAGSVLAQEAQATATTGGGGGVALPGAQAQAAGGSDHSQMVGRFAVGYMGRQSMRIGAGPAGAGTRSIVAPVIGARYWLDNMIGIDAGLGFNISSGSVSVNDTSTDKAGLHAFLLHVGVPLNLADAGHFSFQVIPEANIGFAGTGDYDLGNGTVSDSGFLLNIGARAGAEIHFGFMNIPQLSLQGSVGLYLQHDSASTSNGTDITDSSFTIGTTLGPNPWDLFTSSISALYYF